MLSNFASQQDIYQDCQSCMKVLHSFMYIQWKSKSYQKVLVNVLIIIVRKKCHIMSLIQQSASLTLPINFYQFVLSGVVRTYSECGEQSISLFLRTLHKYHNCTVPSNIYRNSVICTGWFKKSAAWTISSDIKNFLKNILRNDGKRWGPSRAIQTLGAATIHFCCYLPNVSQVCQTTDCRALQSV